MPTEDEDSVTYWLSELKAGDSHRRPAALGALLPVRLVPLRPHQAPGRTPQRRRCRRGGRRPQRLRQLLPRCRPGPVPPTGRSRRPVAAAGDHHGPQGHRPRPTAGRQKRGGGRILDEAALDGPGPGGEPAGLDAIVGSGADPRVRRPGRRAVPPAARDAWATRRSAASHLLKLEGYTLDEIAAQLGLRVGERWPTSSS